MRDKHKQTSIDKLTNQECVQSYKINNILSLFRCTGYRPILDAFKSFAADNHDFEMPDIEDLKLCKKSGQPCQGTCKERSSCHSKIDEDFQWFTPTNLDELKIVLQGLSDDIKYRYGMFSNMSQQIRATY